MKKIKKIIIGSIQIMLAAVLLCNVGVVYAASATHLSFLVDNYDPSVTDYNEYGWDYVGPDYQPGSQTFEYADGTSATVSSIADGGNVKAGEIIRVNVYMDFNGNTTSNTNFSLFVAYDATQLTYLSDPDGNPVKYEMTESSRSEPGKNFIGDQTYYGLFPARASNTTYQYVTYWGFNGTQNVVATYSGFAGKTFVAMNGISSGVTTNTTTTGNVLNNDGILVALYFKVNEDIAAGSTIQLDLPTGSRTLGNNIFADSTIAMTSSSISFVVEGEAPVFDATLSSLTLMANSHDYMETAFDASKEIYTTEDGLVVPNQVSSITMAATTADTAAGLSVTYGKKNVSGSNATQSLDVGNNELYVVVSSPEGQEKVYTLNVKRLDNTAVISSVSGTYGSTTLTFDASNNGNVPSATTSVKILASTQGASTSITSNGIALSDGNLAIDATTTTFTLAVTPENALAQYSGVYGNTPAPVVSKTYTITRQSGNSALSSLLIDGIEYYSSGTTSFTVPVVSNATVSEVTVTADDTKATVDLYASPYSFTQTLSTGNTTRTFKVTAEDGTSTTYSLIFERQKDTDADLSDLQAIVNGQSLLSGFTPAQTTYNLGEIAYVENGVWSVSATKASAKASLSGPVTGKALVVGANTVNVVVTAEDGTQKTYTVTVTMKANTNAVISDGIKIGDESAVYENIVNSKHQYRIEVPYDQTEISMDDFTLTLPTGASISANEGTKALVVGENTYEFTVVAADGVSTETYVVIIERQMSAQAVLTGLTVTGDQGGTLTPVFASGTINYTYNVPANTTSYAISATAGQDGVVDPLTTGNFTLNSADSTHVVKVTAQDGSQTKEYAVRIIRAKSSVNTMSALTMNGDSILDSMVNRQYAATVLHDIAQVAFDYQVTDTKSTVTINGSSAKTFDLAYGLNTFNITVAAEDGTTLTYTVNVTRERSKEARLSELKVNDVMVTSFDSNTFTYTLDAVANEVSSIQVSGTAIDTEATVQISSTTLAEGSNTISVTVTAADGITTQVYQITVERLKSNSSQILSIAPTTAAASAGHVINKESDTRYVVEVPYGTASYSQSMFNLSVLTGSVISYQENPVDLKQDDLLVFTFSVTSPLGQSTTDYEIAIVVQDSLYPLLNGLIINDEPLSNFYRDTLIQSAINADLYLAENETVLKIDFAVDSDVIVVGTATKTLDVAGKLTSTLNVILQRSGYTTTYTFTFTHSLSSDRSLKTLTTSLGDLDIGLADNASGPFEIKVAQNVSGITFQASATHSGAKITGLGPYTDLKPGKNIKTIYVTPEDGSQAQAYSVIVYRELALVSLSVGDIDVDVSAPVDTADGLTYQVSGIPASLASAQVNASANDSSVVLSGDVNKAVNIAAGSGQFSFMLTAQDGLTAIKVVVLTERTASSDARLATLSVNLEGQSLEETFDEDQEDYTLNLPYSIALIDPANDFSWTTVHANTTVTVSSSFAVSDTAENLMEIKTVAEDGTAKTYRIHITRAGYNYLSSLSVGQGEGILNESFDPEVQDYTATIYPDIENFRIYYTVDTAQYPGTYIENEAELSQLNVDDLPKTVEIIVVASNGEKRIYTIAIDTGLSARLSALVPSAGELEFNPNTVNYQIEVAEDTATISFLATAEDAAATISGQYTNVALTKEVTTVSILVKNGNYEKTYQVAVVRLVNETALDTVEIRQGETVWTPVYNEAEKTYVAEVARRTDLSNLEVIASGISDQTLISVSEPISVSESEVKYTIVSTDKNGNTTSYDVIVRYEVSDNNYLSSIHVDNQLLSDFVRTTQDYTLAVADESSFTITAEAEDEMAVVDIVYPPAFTDGSRITVNVTSEKGSVRTYTLMLSRILNQTSLLSELSVSEGALSPQFNELTNDYYVNVTNSVTALNVTALAKENGTVEIIGADYLSEGDNTVEVVVTAENGATNTYYIHVTRAVLLDNPLTSLTVVGAVHGAVALSPGFSAAQRNYTVEVERDESMFDIQVETADNLRVTGDGTVTITSFPEVREIRIFNSENDVEVYYITFTQKPSSNADLANLWTDQGYFDQIFSGDTTGYTLSVGNEIEQIELLYTLSETVQQVDGAGIKTLSEGRNRFAVVVTAQDGTTKTYTVTVIRGTQSGATLSDLSVSEGELSPKFKASTHVYYVQVDETISELTISASAPEGSTVTGTGNVALEVGANTFDISVDNGDETSTYTVVIHRGAVESVYLSRFSLDGYSSNEPFVKTTFDYTVDIYSGSIITPKITAVAEDPNATVTLDVPATMGQGQYTITATVSLPSGASQIYTMNVDLLIYKIRSDIHEVGETYIPTIHAEQTVSDVKSQMLNDANTLQLFYNGELLAEDALVPSGTIIKLIVNGVTYDQKTLIVLGDANRDGRIGVGDVQVLQTYVLGASYDEVAQLTADANKDVNVGVGDVIAVRSHILQTYDLYGEGE